MDAQEPGRRSKPLWLLAPWGICVTGLGVLVWTGFSTSRHDAEIAEIVGAVTVVAAGAAVGVYASSEVRRKSQVIESTLRFASAACQARRAAMPMSTGRGSVPGGGAISSGRAGVRHSGADDSGFHYILNCGRDDGDTDQGGLGAAHSMPRRRRRSEAS